MHTQNRGKALRIHIVFTVDNKFPGYHAHKINGRIWYVLKGKNATQNMGWKDKYLSYRGAYIGGKSMV